MKGSASIRVDATAWIAGSTAVVVIGDALSCGGRASFAKEARNRSTPACSFELVAISCGRAPISLASRVWSSSVSASRSALRTRSIFVSTSWNGTAALPRSSSTSSSAFFGP